MVSTSARWPFETSPAAMFVPPPLHIDMITPPPCHRLRGVAFGGGWRQCGVRRVVVAVSRKQSSALANQQYDIQSLSRVVDGVDKWFDLRGS